MHPIEVERVPNADQQKPQQKPNRICAERGGWQCAIGIAPPKTRFIHRPDRDAAYQRVGNVVPNLSAKGKDPCRGRGPASIIPQGVPLLSPCVEPQVQKRSEGRQHQNIPQPDRENPTW